MAAWHLYVALAPLQAAAVFLMDYAHPKRWLIASSPSGGLYYASLPRGGTLDSGAEMETLLPSNASGLTTPRGIAVDLRKQRLFVADPGASQIVAFPLLYSSDPSKLSVGSPVVWATGTSARWVAVDDDGNIFFEDGTKDQIQSITAAQKSAGNTTPQVLYDAQDIVALSSPGGLAVDSYWIYYVNKELGSQHGSVVRAPKGGVSAAWAAANPDLLQTVVEPLVTNSEESYGVCLAMSNLFYTQPTTYVYGILASSEGAGTYATINDRMTNPRGCTFDGDGTVYIADEGAGAIYALAGNQQVLQPALVQKTATVEGVYDVAVFSYAKRFALLTPVCVLFTLLVATVSY